MLERAAHLICINSQKNLQNIRHVAKWNVNFPLRSQGLDYADVCTQDVVFRWQKDFKSRPSQYFTFFRFSFVTNNRPIDAKEEGVKQLRKKTFGEIVRLNDVPLIK